MSIFHCVLIRAALKRHDSHAGPQAKDKHTYGRSACLPNHCPASQPTIAVFISEHRQSNAPYLIRTRCMIRLTFQSDASGTAFVLRWVRNSPATINDSLTHGRDRLFQNHETPSAVHSTVRDAFTTLALSSSDPGSTLSNKVHTHCVNTVRLALSGRRLEMAVSWKAYGLTVAIRMGYSWL